MIYIYRKLVIRFKTGVTLVSFSLPGKPPEVKDKLKICVSGSAIWLETDLTTLVKKPSRPMPLQFCKLLIVSVTSLIVQGTMNIESELGFRKVSNIEIVLETGWIWEAKVGPTFAKKSLNLETMTLRSFTTN